ncbi:MAG: hypothetical protein HZA95_03910 [Candidatus Vogelbacteria bacterium]|nr:hypothetical protein [Candidatus Vogelbacteria bacterium]
MLKRRKFTHEHFVVVISCVAVSFLLIKGGTPQLLLNASAQFQILSSFIAGMFFTSLVTMPFAYAAIGGLSGTVPIVTLALVGSAGATMVDMFMLSIVEEGVDAEIEQALSKNVRHRIEVALSHPFLHWLVPIVGALIIPSPLPDEIGLALMGLTKMKPIYVAPICFIMNAIGIFAIVWVAQMF